MTRSSAALRNEKAKTPRLHCAMRRQTSASVKAVERKVGDALGSRHALRVGVDTRSLWRRARCDECVNLKRADDSPQVVLSGQV